MRNIGAIAARELRSYFGSPLAYIITAIFLIVTGYGFAWNSITYLETTIQGFLGWGSFFLILLIPALTMRLLAREVELGTMELLLTAPVRDSEVVLGKFLAGLGILGVMLSLTLYYPALLIAFGHPDLGPLASGYLGLFLLGAVFLAVGLFASSLTASQMIAFVLASAIVLALWFIGQTAAFAEGSSREVLRYISLSTYLPDFGKGIIDTRAIVYYLSLIALFLFMTLRSLEMRRWR